MKSGLRTPELNGKQDGERGVSLNLERFLESLEIQGFSLRPAGFFNVEGGDAALSTSFFPWCDSCLEFLGPALSPCEECGRGPGRFIRVPAGDGDGVYVVFEIFEAARPKFAVGAIVIFDNRYGIADAIRDPILQQRLPMVSNYLFEDQLSAFGVALGSLESTNQILFSDANAGTDSRDAAVDVRFDVPQTLTAYALVQQVSSDPDAEADRLVEEAGMDRESVMEMLQSLVQVSSQVRDMPKGYGTLPEISIRGLLVLTDEANSKLKLQPKSFDLDWETLTGQFMGKVGTSHIQPMGAAAIWFNALLAREVDRAAGEVNDDEAKQLLFDMWTWAYQGAVNGDGDCASLLTNAYKPSQSEVVELLERRGLLTAAETFIATGLVGDLQVGPGVRSEESGTPAPSSLESSPRDSSQPQANFCGECGSKFASEMDKFCSECGSQR